MSEPQDNNPKDKAPKAGDMDVSMIDDKAGIHSFSDGARHMERAQEKDVEVTEGKERGSWQIKQKSES
jgi:hypothetical protein